VRLGVPIVPRLQAAAAVGFDAAAARTSNDSVRSSALDDQSDLYAILNGPGSITAGAIGPPALTRASCSANAVAWANDTCVLTSTCAEPAAGRGRGALFTVDDLFRHSRNADATGALVAIEETALESPGHHLQGHGGNDDPCARQCHSRAAKTNRALMKRPG
jgi:hypothetical protein